MTYCCCWQISNDEQRQPLIEDALIPRLVALSRQHRTLYALYGGNAQRFRMLGASDDAQKAEADAARELRYYENLVALKRVLEDARLTLDASAGVIQWNQEVSALIAQMPADARQELGEEFALHFPTQ